MRFSRERVAGLAKTVVETLANEGLIDFKEKRAHKAELVSKVDALILKELQVEDLLHEEVREIMKKHEKKIREGEADYQTLFQMIKKQLMRDRE